MDRVVVVGGGVLGTMHAVAARPPVQRRWAGVYSEAVSGEIAGGEPASGGARSHVALYHCSQVAPGVVLVTGPGGAHDLFTGYR